MSKVIQAADLFCGAGGASTGLMQACAEMGLSVELVAVNHWDRAVATHSINHPSARHFCAPVDAVEPSKAVPGGRLDLLIAGVECTHHSQARGGKPMSDQSRASAWHVAHWADKLRAGHVLIENVPEFANWGPLDDSGRPIKAKKGQIFHAFVQALEAMDYRVEWRTLNSADYGDPQARRRFFLQARRGGGQIKWPEPSHQEAGGTKDLKAWRTAREIIDWSDLGSSIFARKRPLADRTIARISEGIRRFCGEMAEPFLLMLTHGGRLRSVDRPMPTVTCAKRGEIAVVHPFILPHDQFPGKNGLSLVDSIDRPTRTVTAHNGACNSLVAPFIIPHFGERAGQAPRTHSIDAPAPTVTATKGAGSLVSPFLVPYYGTGVPSSVDEPLRTVTTKDRFALITPEGHALDIYFRMLKPGELAAAQGFPADYQFEGNKGEVVRQIGNAVPVSTAQSLCRSILEAAA